MDSQNDAFLKRLLETFALEAKEHIDNLSNGLLELKKNNDDVKTKSLVEVLFREAHSFKGAARAVAIPEIEEVCKGMEDIFNRYKQSGSKIPNILIDVMLEGNDLLLNLSKSDETKRRDSKPLVQDMLQRLQQQAQRVDTPQSEAIPQPSQMQEDKPEVFAEIPRIIKKDMMSNQDVFMRKEEFSTSETIRVPVKKLNAIMTQAEEMLFAKIASKRHLEQLHALIDEIDEFRSGEAGTDKIKSMVVKAFNQAKRDKREIDLIVDRLQEEMKEALMLPFSTLFYTLPKIVHDIAKSVGKEVILNVIGGDIEIDRRILEDMSDPLMHLLRNAIDHGIEDPVIRLKKGKEPTGTITLELEQINGSKVEISIRDDGAGIDAERLMQSAVKRGLIDQEKAESLDRESALNLVFLSGVSTSKIVSDLSGRGLGMAIVQEKAEYLGGQVRVHSTVEGSEFKVLLPLSMATFRGVQVSLNNQKFIFPSEHIVRVMTIKIEMIKTVEGKSMMVVNHQVIPYYALVDILELSAVSNQSAETAVVVITMGSTMLAIGVDTIDYEEEVMVKSLGSQLVRIKNIAGAALLASDVPGLILNISDIFKSAGTGVIQKAVTKTEILNRKHKILVVDDSMTTRTLLQSIISMVGYDVVSAVDGADGYEKLIKEEIDLVVSDVDMPRMNGFELTESIRSNAKYSELPIILVTSLESQEDKDHGMRCGASAYIVKSSFDQKTLLDTIAWLIDLGNKGD